MDPNFSELIANPQNFIVAYINGEFYVRKENVQSKSNR